MDLVVVVMMAERGGGTGNAARDGEEGGGGWSRRMRRDVRWMDCIELRLSVRVPCSGLYRLRYRSCISAGDSVLALK